MRSRYIVVAGACLTQFYFAPRMADLRENSHWVNGELTDPAERMTSRRAITAASAPFLR